MKVRRSLSKALCGVVLASGALVAPAAAAPVTFATMSSLPGVPQILFTVGTGALSSADVATPYDPSDAFFTSAPGNYSLVLPAAFGPVIGVLKIAPVFPAGVIDPLTTAYGPGTFSIGIDTGPYALPWLQASFSQMVLSLSADLLTGVLSDFGHTTFSGLGFDVTGLTGPGSFAFALANPIFYRNDLGALEAIGYEITAGALAAEAIPEPTTLMLLGIGLAAGAVRTHRSRPTRGVA